MILRLMSKCTGPLLLINNKLISDFKVNVNYFLYPSVYTLK